MKLTIDTELNELTYETPTGLEKLDLYSKESFELVSRYWLKIGWDQKYVYTFSWLGRPIIQLPEDMIRIQEVIYDLKPDFIVETGIAHGGSLIYYASLCRVIDKGRVIGIDVEIRPHNRAAIENHELFSYIDLIEGDSTAKDTLTKVNSIIKPGDSVLVILDSHHSKQHVLDELTAYQHLVAKDSYLVATDGIMYDLHDVPRGQGNWSWDNPATAASEFQKSHPEFILEQPPWPFNESLLDENITHWPSAWLKRK